MRNKTIVCIIAFVSIPLFASQTFAVEKNIAVETQTKSDIKAEIKGATELFDKYKKLDQACDPKLIDLYEDDATIDSDVERKGAPLQCEKYDRKKFADLIAKTFADPALKEISQKTTYDTPEFSHETGKELCVDFHAYNGDSAIKVHWKLRKTAAGDWHIFKEHTVTFRKSHGRTTYAGGGK